MKTLHVLALPLVALSMGACAAKPEIDSGALVPATSISTAVPADVSEPAVRLSQAVLPGVPATGTVVENTLQTDDGRTRVYRGAS